MKSSTRPVFLFDGDCGVCQNGTDTIRSKVKPPVDIYAYQNVDLAEYGVSETDVLEGPVFVRTDGSHVIGPLGMAEMLRSARAPFKYMGSFMLVPGVRHTLNAVGPSMYRNRYRLPGSQDTCRVPQPDV
jgi:predicted DCC family thiol-disulfide oxidoreductase YuxK